MSEFVEVSVSDLSGVALNWAVAMAEGYRADPEQEEGDGQTVISPEGFYTSVSKRGAADGFGYRPSTDWSQGGPLMDKHCKGFGMLQDSTDSRWRSSAYSPETGMQRMVGGETILIAFCRALVALKLGDVVSVPKDLCHD